MKRLLLIAAVVVGAVPVQASVYATQNKDGSFTVRKYNDGDPKVHIVDRDMSKTKEVYETKTVPNYKHRFLTEAGRKKQAAYKKADEAWKAAPSTHNGVTQPFSNGLAWCGSGGCNFPKPGTHGRPAEPNYKKGVDFNYGTKTEKVRVTKPNPNYLQPEEPEVFFSERAAKPGGLPIIGKTERMNRGDFHNYENWLYNGR